MPESIITNQQQFVVILGPPFSDLNVFSSSLSIFYDSTDNTVVGVYVLWSKNGQNVKIDVCMC